MLWYAAITLAQQSTGRVVGSIVLWAGLAAVLVVAMVVIALFVRRRLLGQDDTTVGGGAFTIGDLRDLRAQGKITAEEFERARQALVANELSRLNHPNPGPDSDNETGANARR